ncbi:rna-directed dna polymerase from mobile element jockey- hypothetical protein [Limosa lapponica baueri]|uniref:Rna-directed dna polymerase from mobile element jockey-like n=1 Tax=Limosa lapponica baueri TaxID=1758121 RepID=A0A2I0U4X2_LIMLA|nr:rna-directed dna polymerase from mobile element jockey- hypothetical protein [Limosa lapponica baueri]
MDLLVIHKEELVGDVMVDGSFGWDHDSVDLRAVKKAGSTVTTLTAGNWTFAYSGVGLGSWGRILMTAMKKASVMPIFKTGKKEDPGNDRPISLTSVPAKVLEQNLLETMSKDIKTHKGQEGIGLHRKNPSTDQYKLEADWLGISSAEKDLRIWVDNRLTMNQERNLVGRKATSILGCMQKRLSSRWKEVILPFAALGQLVSCLYNDILDTSEEKKMNKDFEFTGTLKHNWRDFAHTLFSSKA